MEMIIKEPGESLREAREREGRREFELGMRAWLAIAPREVTHTVDGKPLFCLTCLADVATSRNTHRCPADGGTQNSPFTLRD